MKQLVFFFLTSVLLLSVPVNAAEAETLLVGAASADVTGEPGTEMFGFFHREHPSIGIQSRLFARAVYLENKPETLVWIVVDSGAIGEEINVRVKTALAKEFGVEPWRIVISVTHTHSAPTAVRINIGCKYAEEYVESILIPGMLKAARDAKASIEACSMVSATGEVELGVERRGKPTKHVEKRVPAVGFKRADGTFKTVILGYTMHPVSLASKSRVIAAEWPGAAADAIRNTFTKETEALVFQGACGNINTPEWYVDDEKMYSWGKLLVDSVAEQLKKAEPQKPHFAVCARRIAILYDYPDDKKISEFVESVRKQLGDHPKVPEACEKWERWATQYRNNGGADFLDAEIAAVVLGDRTFVTGPFETLSWMNPELAKHTPIDCFAVGYTNGCYGYLSHDAAYDEGGYEPNMVQFYYLNFRFKRGELERLAANSAPLVQQAFDASRQR
ncbi:MAG: neutral/alkaline non-lysosomal ceramidase N-terminal domain-containing protein [Planctomycetaceae bacterium]|nr:neutral/alkaline non-lysosomal ceramidase N-terminal domain-containing protein [Planctomycetaceae bacterium]